MSQRPIRHFLVFFIALGAIGASACGPKLSVSEPKSTLRHFRVEDAIAARQQTFVDHGGPTREIPVAGGSLGGTWTPLFTGEPEFDALHYRISMTFPRASLVRPAFDGIVELTFKPVTEGYQLLTLDSTSANQVKKITLLNKFEELRFRQNGQKLEIDLNRPYGVNDTLTVSIEYHWDGALGKGVFFKSRNGVKDVEAIYTQSEPEISKFWFPTNSHPNDRASFESFITVPEEFTAVSNGALSGVSTKDGMKTFHWSMSIPQASYLFVATAGKFGVHHENWNGIPVDYYGPSNDMDRVAYSLRDTPDMLSFFSGKTGYRFPYEKYAQAVVPQYAWGGMEHTTATTLTDKTLHSPDEDAQYSSNHLVAHELAHQWFGDLITCKSWDHLWLNEGFASYFDALYQEHSQGRANYLKTMVGVSAWYFMEEDQEARPVVFPYYHSALDEYFDSHAYAKGSWVLHMLRNTLGDEVFFKGIQTYLFRYQGQVAKTEMFRKVMEEVSGKDLYWFFDQWLMKPGYPQFDVGYDWDMRTHEVVLTVKQVQDLTKPGGIPGTTPLFEGPIDVEVAGKNYRVFLNGKNAPDPGREIFRLASEKYPDYVKFNAGTSWLAKVTLAQLEPAWIAQLQKSKDVTARIEASRVLSQGRWRSYESNKEFKPAGEALIACAKSDPEIWVRASCTKDMADLVRTAIGAGVSKKDELLDRMRVALVSLTKDPEWSVREAAVKVLGSFPAPQALLALPTIQDVARKDEAVNVAAAAIESLGRLGPVLAEEDKDSYELNYGFVLAQLSRTSFQDKIRETTLSALTTISDFRSLSIGEEFAAPRYPESIRRSAYGLIAGVGAKLKNETRERARVLLEAALSDVNYVIRKSAIAAIVTLGDRQSIPALEQVAANDPDERVRIAARDAIAKLQK